VHDPENRISIKPTKCGNHKAMPNNIKLPIVIGAFAVIIISIAAIMVFKGDIEDKSSSGGPNDRINGFTFFDVGADTQVTRNLRSELEEKLGSGSLETWSTINLEFLFPGFLNQYFPELYRLNRKLNDERGQRIEHDTVKLTYRYIPKEIFPFDYVELMFSRKSGLPLYCFIKTKNAGDGIASLLKSKFGEPRKIDWGNPEEYSLVWNKSGDDLIFSNTPDLLGSPTYQIVIYFTSNIKHMIKTEKKDNGQSSKNKDNVLKKAF
jgi:hypothetical protein